MFSQETPTPGLMIKYNLTEFPDDQDGECPLDPVNTGRTHVRFHSVRVQHRGSWVCSMRVPACSGVFRCVPVCSGVLVCLSSVYSGVLVLVFNGSLCSVLVCTGSLCVRVYPGSLCFPVFFRCIPGSFLAPSVMVFPVCSDLWRRRHLPPHLGPKFSNKQGKTTPNERRCLTARRAPGVAGKSRRLSPSYHRPDTTTTGMFTQL